MTRQHHHQYGSTSTSHNGLIIGINNAMQFWWQADMLQAHTGTIHNILSSMPSARISLRRLAL
jgi:hypothetical protein